MCTALTTAFGDRGDVLIESFLDNSVAPTPDDQRCIEERHLEHKVTGMYAVEGSRCRHGVPRAFMQFPVAGKISSGMVRLTCPHLVKAIDEWEADGAIDDFNARLEEDGAMRDNFAATNAAHKELRNHPSAISAAERGVIMAKLGDEVGSNLINSGIIGISPGRVRDVKCLHAHTADELLRGKNDIGRMALEGLRERGVDPTGCDACQQQCNLQLDKGDAGWWYMPAKNKQRLRAKKERRKVFKASLRDKKNALKEVC